MLCYLARLSDVFADAVDHEASAGVPTFRTAPNPRATAIKRVKMLLALDRPMPFEKQGTEEGNEVEVLKPEVLSELSPLSDSTDNEQPTDAFETCLSLSLDPDLVEKLVKQVNNYKSNPPTYVMEDSDVSQWSEDGSGESEDEDMLASNSESNEDYAQPRGSGAAYSAHSAQEDIRVPIGYDTATGHHLLDDMRQIREKLKAANET